MNYQQLLEQVKSFAISFFESHKDDRLKYHNITHTQSVVAAAMQIADHYQLNDEDFFAVITAAWFHDTGYGIDLNNHEEKSIQIVTDFLKGLNVNEEILKKIHGCIRATKMPQHPTNLLESIICDADLFHLGTDDFRRKSKKMREEVQGLTGKEIPKAAWRETNIRLLENHEYHTDYCRLLLKEKTDNTLEELKKKGGNSDIEKDDSQAQQKQTLPTDKPEKKGEKSKKQGFSKGVETMFRITASNQQRLSNMADSKAHIMISVNSIIISLLLSLLLRKMDQHHRQIIPAILLLTINLITIVFSILATRPNITLGKYTQEDIERKNVNLLFFGNFFKMSLDDYTASMFNMMGDNEFLYKSLVRDVYAQGVVLGRKYHLLRISYNVFMYGIIVSVISFVISALV